MVENGAAVTDHFGYWPEFCDAKVRAFSFDSQGTVLMSLYYIDSNIKKHATVSLVFRCVTELTLSDLESENVIDELQFERGDLIAVTLIAAYGLSGTFKCSSIAVAAMEG
jgi:Immunity protein 50